MNRLSFLSSPDGWKYAPVAIALAVALWVGHPALALLVGATVSLALSPKLPSYFNRAGHLCLKAAIVSLGFTLNVQVLWQTSRDHSGLIVIFVICTLIAGLVIGRLMKVDEDQSRLLSTGTAICGGTAIVTLAPIIRARPESVAICIGIVFILNAIAILLLPWVGHYLEMTQDQFGVWVALAIHDTSSVVGAAAIFGDRALEVATTVKLVRTLLLIPIALMAGVLLRQSEAKLADTGVPCAVRSRFPGWKSAAAASRNHRPCQGGESFPAHRCAFWHRDGDPAVDDRVAERPGRLAECLAVADPVAGHAGRCAVPLEYS